MWKFLKTMVAEDVITTEEAQVVLAAEVVLREEKAVLPHEEKADLEATETLLQEKVVSEAKEEALREEKVHRTELQEDPIILETVQDQEEQEETNYFC